VADHHTWVRDDDRKETVYFPYAQWVTPGRLVFYVRTAGSEERMAAAIRQVVHGADGNLPAPEVKPINLRIRESLYTDRLLAALATAFGLLATLMSGIGLYGVMAYSVARRTGEIGLRMALGALPGDVLRMVMSEAGRLTGVGIVIGLAAACALSRLVESQLFGVKAANPAVLALAATTVAGTAIVAALAPGWRASRIQPVQALKEE
jgi:predicted lysophospholipase L1 biosynthesis ABC-type transport system permease subunit